MDKAEQKHIEEMERIKTAIKKTKSSYLKADYIKHLHRMERELIEYRKYRGVCNG